MSDADKHGWTIATYAAHNEALRLAEEKFQAERDLRYKESRDAADRLRESEKEHEAEAMELARAIQTYKDEKANELREQLGRERLDYASKNDLKASVDRLEAIITPVIASVSAQAASGRGMRDMWGWIVGGIAVGILVINFVQGRGATPPQAPIIIQVPASPSTSQSTTSTTTNTGQSGQQSK